MRTARFVTALVMAALSIGVVWAEDTAIPVGEPTPALASAGASQAISLAGLGIPALDWKSSCTATQYCANWYINISCSGTTSCTVGTSSVTCDGVTTNCPAGTCDPVASGCAAQGLQEEWCQCVLDGGNTAQARIRCSKALCF